VSAGSVGAREGVLVSLVVSDNGRLMFRRDQTCFGDLEKLCLTVKCSSASKLNELSRAR
jgi:hypothetical protein